MTPIKTFLNWFENENEEIKNSITFQILYLAPDFEIVKIGNSDNIFEKFCQYFTLDKEINKIVGKLIFVKSTIDFLINDYEDIDALIDSQNFISSVINNGEADGLNMSFSKQIHKNGAERFEQRKKFKNNWLTFSESNFNYKIFDQYLKNSLLKQ